MREQIQKRAAIEKIRKRLAGISKKLHSEQLSVVEFCGKRKAEFLENSPVSEESFSIALQKFEANETAGKGLVRFEVLLFLAITFFYFDFSPDFQFTFLKLELSTSVVLSLLFSLSVTNIHFFMRSFEQGVQRQFLIEILKRNAGLDASGILKLSLSGKHDPLSLLNSSVGQGIYNSAGMILGVFPVFTFVSLILIGALCVMGAIPILTSWELAQKNEWGWVFSGVFSATVIGVLCRLVVMPILLERVKFRFVDTTIERVFWDDVEKYGPDGAIELLLERISESGKGE